MSDLLMAGLFLVCYLVMLGCHMLRLNRHARVEQRTVVETVR